MPGKIANPSVRIMGMPCTIEVANDATIATLTGNAATVHSFAENEQCLAPNTIYRQPLWRRWFRRPLQPHAHIVMPPLDTNLVLWKVNSNTTIPALAANVGITGEGSFTIGRVESFVLELANGTANVEEIDGNCRIVVSQDVTVNVYDGVIDQANVSPYKDCFINISAYVGNLRSHMGSDNDVHLLKVNGGQITGRDNNKISITQVTGHLKIDAGANTYVSIGAAKRLTLDCGSHSSIEVKELTGDSFCAQLDKDTALDVSVGTPVALANVDLALGTRAKATINADVTGGTIHLGRNAELSLRSWSPDVVKTGPGRLFTIG